MAGIDNYKDSSADIIYEQIQDKPTTRLGLGQAAWRGSTQSLQFPAKEERSQFSLTPSIKCNQFCLPSVPPSKILVSAKERKQATSSSSNLELSDGLNLQDLVTKRGDWFPLRVKITKMKTSDSKWGHVGVGETYNVYSIKGSDKAFTFSDPRGGAFTLPSDANVCCALVYSLEQENFEKDAGVHTFKQVSDIIRAQPIPKIVCATRIGTGKSVESSVVPGEILRVSGVQNDKRCLLVYSYTLECVKVLDGECSGNFTTNPAVIQLPLAQVITELNVTFPCKVQLFPSNGNRGAVFPPNATSRVLWMNAPSEPSVIMAASNISEPRGNQLLEIPVTSDIEAVVVEVCGKELLELKAQSARLLHKEDGLKAIESCASSFQDVMRTPPQTYMALRDSAKASTASGVDSVYTIANSAASEKLNVKGDNMDGSNGVMGGTSQTKPPPTYPRTATTANRSASPCSSASGAPIILAAQPKAKAKEPSSDASLRSKGPSLVAAIEERFKCKRLSGDSAITQVSMTSGDSTGDCDIETLRIKYAEVKEDLEKCQSLLKDYRDALMVTQKDVDKLKCSVESIYAQLSCTNEDEGVCRVITEQNKSRLATFSFDEVLQLLDALGLSQYKKKFMAERVSGRLLLQCNEKVLEKELGMGNKLHRLQLMHVIEGKDCAYSIITKM